MEEAALSSRPQYSVNDLITSSKEIEKGFIAQTLEKSNGCPNTNLLLL